jgi:hypothetical protein
MTSSTLISAFAEDVRHYLQLSPRQLPSMYLYDALGSALFDAICELPWYRITHAEMRLLECHRTEIFARLPELTHLVEARTRRRPQAEDARRRHVGAADRASGRCLRWRVGARGAHAV